MSSLFSHACPKTWTPLLDGPVDDLLIKHLPFFNKTSLEAIDVTNVGAIHPPFQYAPDVIVNLTKIRAVGRWYNCGCMKSGVSRDSKSIVSSAGM